MRNADEVHRDNHDASTAQVVEGKRLGMDIQIHARRGGIARGVSREPDWTSGCEIAHRNTRPPGKFSTSTRLRLPKGTGEDNAQNYEGQPAHSHNAA